MKPINSARKTIFLLLLIVIYTTNGQVTDNFSDGNFTSNPTWAGNDAKFIISTGQLKLQAPALAETAYLSTSSVAIHNASWEFFVRMDFNPSNTNYARIYLVSDHSDLTQPLNGYYVMVGNTADEISLYKQSGSTVTKIIDGLDGRLNLNTFTTKIKVTRSASGLWTLFSDVGSTGSYSTEGSVTDITHTISGYLGVYCVYTSTRSTLFWFDDFIVTGTIVPDLNPPMLSEIKIINENTLEVVFNETLDQLTAENPGNYTINKNIDNPSIVALKPDMKSVTLSLANPLTNGLNYTIQVAGVKDPDGNEMSIAQMNFLYFIPQPVNKDDIIISEFMADQSPVVGLPEAEYVELLNRSSNPINLLGWKLTDGSSIATLPNFILLPNTFLLITATTNANKFSGAIGVSNFPSLNNSGDDIMVRSELGKTIDSIHYSTSWYHSDEKKDGGWSLEIIDPENFCGEETNWTSSTSALGGTPGLVNSVNATNPDNQAPKIISSQVKPNQVEIFFNEKMDGNPVNFSIVPLTSFEETKYNTTLRQLTLTSTSPLLSSIPYSLTLLDAKDCSGNFLENSPLQFVLPEKAEPGDILVNEILFNPRTGGVDFVEVYNKTSKYINFKKWTVANYDGMNLTNSKSMASPSIIVHPNSYRVVTTDSSILISHYPNTVRSSCIVSSLPSFPDDQGSVALVDSLGNIIDYFIYNENYHLNTLSSKEGVSLERISLTGPSNDTNNWRSASETENFATPGYKNSASYPFVTTLSVLDLNTLFISFSAPLEPNSAQLRNNFLLNQNEENPTTVEIQNGDKDLLITFSQNFTNGLNYSLTISGIKDPDGTTLPTITRNFLFFEPSPVNPKDIIVSEFMADPAPVVGLPEVEYVELFNRSNSPVNLQGWKLGDGSTTATLSQYILLPASHCVITTSAGSLLYPESMGVSGFPSLNNTSDNIILKTQAGVTVDSITYFLSWYHSDEKKDGGWSLEIIDPDNGCEEEGNWTSSENLNGGTPGATNSVDADNLDLTNPTVQTIVTSRNGLEILFDEKMDGSLVPTLTIDPFNRIINIQYDKFLRKLKAQVENDFQFSTPYSLAISNAYDCSGNGLESSSHQFILPDSGKIGDIFLNEILFNPKTGGVDFVEIYNRTNKTISLKKWSLVNLENDTATNLKVIKMVNPIIHANSFIAFTSNPGILKSHYPRTVDNALVSTTLPSLPDDEGSVALTDSLGKIIDYFNYKATYHTPFLKDNKGVSLERIMFDAETNDPNNWRSASQSENYATPGYKNSASSISSGFADSEITVEPEIFSPELPPNDFTKINYRFDQVGKVANITILDHQGRLIKTLCNNEVLGAEGFFRWDGDREDGGRARSGYYLAVVEVFDSSGVVNTFRKRVVIAYR